MEDSLRDQLGWLPGDAAAFLKWQASNDVVPATQLAAGYVAWLWTGPRELRRGATLLALLRAYAREFVTGEPPDAWTRRWIETTPPDIMPPNPFTDGFGFVRDEWTEVVSPSSQAATVSWRLAQVLYWGHIHWMPLPDNTQLSAEAALGRKLHNAFMEHAANPTLSWTVPINSVQRERQGPVTLEQKFQLAALSLLTEGRVTTTISFGPEDGVSFINPEPWSVSLQNAMAQIWPAAARRVIPSRYVGA